MVTICRHIKTNGQRCGSPALRVNYFCYYHDKIHNVGAEPNLKYGPLQLPAPKTWPPFNSPSHASTTRSSTA